MSTKGDYDLPPIPGMEDEIGEPEWKLEEKKQTEEVTKDSKSTKKGMEDKIVEPECKIEEKNQTEDGTKKGMEGKVGEPKRKIEEKNQVEEVTKGSNSENKGVEEKIGEPKGNMEQTNQMEEVAKDSDSKKKETVTSDSKTAQKNYTKKVGSKEEKEQYDAEYKKSCRGIASFLSTLSPSELQEDKNESIPKQHDPEYLSQVIDMGAFPGSFKGDRLNLLCEVCNIELNSEIMMEAHMNGSKHRRRAALYFKCLADTQGEKVVSKEAATILPRMGTLRKDLDSSVPSYIVTDPTALSKTGKNQGLICTICGVKLSSMGIIQSHIEGMKHKEKEAAYRHQMEIEGKHPCEIKMTEKSSIPMKVGHKSHVGDLHRLLQKSTNPVIGLQFIEEFVANTFGTSPIYRCTLCGAESNDVAMYNHIIGHKHRSKVIERLFNIRSGLLTKGECLQEALDIDRINGRNFALIKVIKGNDSYPWPNKKGRYVPPPMLGTPQWMDPQIQSAGTSAPGPLPNFGQGVKPMGPIQGPPTVGPPPVPQPIGIPAGPPTVGPPPVSQPMRFPAGPPTIGPPPVPQPIGFPAGVPTVGPPPGPEAIRFGAALPRPEISQQPFPGNSALQPQTGQGVSTEINQGNDAFTFAKQPVLYENVRIINRSIAISAMDKAMTDVNTGQYVNAGKTIEDAIASISQSKVGNEPESQKIITSLQEVQQRIVSTEQKQQGIKQLKTAFLGINVPPPKISTASKPVAVPSSMELDTLKGMHQPNASSAAFERQMEADKMSRYVDSRGPNYILDSHSGRERHSRSPRERSASPDSERERDIARRRSLSPHNRSDDRDRWEDMRTADIRRKWENIARGRSPSLSPDSRRSPSPLDSYAESRYMRYRETSDRQRRQSPYIRDSPYTRQTSSPVSRQPDMDRRHRDVPTRRRPDSTYKTRVDSPYSRQPVSPYRRYSLSPYRGPDNDTLYGRSPSPYRKSRSPYRKSPSPNRRSPARSRRQADNPYRKRANHRNRKSSKRQAERSNLQAGGTRWNKPGRPNKKRQETQTGKAASTRDARARSAAMTKEKQVTEVMKNMSETALTAILSNLTKMKGNFKMKSNDGETQAQQGTQLMKPPGKMEVTYPPLMPGSQGVQMPGNQATPAAPSTPFINPPPPRIGPISYPPLSAYPNYKPFFAGNI